MVNLTRNHADPKTPADYMNDSIILERALTWHLIGDGL